MELAALDPAVGLLHELRRKRPSLALDLMEEFRPLVVDQVVGRLCTAVKVTLAGFTVDPDGTRGCRMDADTLRIFHAACERRMLTPAHHPIAGRRTSYRAALAFQARHLAAIVTGRTAAYTPTTWR